MRLHAAALLPAVLLAACATQPGADSSVRILSGYNPEFTTVREEQARARALTAAVSFALTPGQYCTTFIDDNQDQPVTGRVELNILKDKRYLLAMRYQAGSTIWSRSSGGVYAVKGALLSLLSASGSELNYPLKSITPDSVLVWGDLPLTRSGCAGKPLTGRDYLAAVRTAQDDIRADFPW